MPSGNCIHVLAEQKPHSIHRRVQATVLCIGHDDCLPNAYIDVLDLQIRIVVANDVVKGDVVVDHFVGILYGNACACDTWLAEVNFGSTAIRSVYTLRLSRFERLAVEPFGARLG